MKINKRFDRQQYGIILGLVVPVLAFIVTWAIRYEGSLGAYLENFYRINKLASLISLAAIPNLLVFFIFIWTNMNRAARGVLIATFLMAAIMLVVKYLV